MFYLTHGLQTQLKIEPNDMDKLRDARFIVE